jgi:hypothetical protein
MIVAAVLLTLQVTVVVMFCVLPSVKVPVAVNCCVVPTGQLVTVVGLIAMEASTAAVMLTGAFPLTVPRVAVTVALPTAEPVTKP